MDKLRNADQYRNEDGTLWHKYEVQSVCRSAAIYRISKGNIVKSKAVDESSYFPNLKKQELEACLSAAEGEEKVIQIRDTPYNFHNVDNCQYAKVFVSD